MKNSFIFGCLLVGIANFFIGFNIITTKFLIKNAIPISILLTLRYLFGCIILFPVLCFSKNRFKFYLTHERYNDQQKIIYILMALLGGSIFNAIYINGMQNTTAIATGMTGSTVPLLVVAFSAVFLKQKIKFYHIFCALLVAFGIFIIVFANNRHEPITSSTQSSQIPILIVFMAMIPEAIYNVLAAMLPQKIAPIMSAFLINLINFLSCIPFFIYSSFNYSVFDLQANDILLCFLIGFFSGALYYSFYSAGIQKINAQTAGLLTGVVPITTTILAIVLLKEYFGFLSFLGMAFVLIAIYLSVKFSQESMAPN